MKKLFFAGILLLMAAAGFAQKDSLSRNLENFHGLVVFGNIKLTLHFGDENKISLQSSTYDLSKVIVSVDKGILTVRSNALGDEKEVVAVLTCKSLDQIKTDAGANIVESDTIRGTTVMLKAVKGSLMRVKVAAANLQITSTQGSEIRVQGKAGFFVAKSASGALIDAYKLKAFDAEATANMGGKINLLVTGSIRAKAATGGIINYKGNPEKESTEPKMGGEIHKL